MRNFSLLLVLISLMALGGCAVQQPVTITSKFDYEYAKQLSSETGKNTIRGSGVIRQSGGGIVTSAGNEVILTPVTAYAKERIQYLYGNDQNGYNPMFGGKNAKFEPDLPEYRTFTRTSTCDAQGFFKFERVPDGEYYIITWIVWSVPNAGVQGGALMQRVKVQGGETKEIVLTPR